ncbi:unnamed protein product, partial [Meganyctiphanes norvegica]
MSLEIPFSEQMIREDNLLVNQATKETKTKAKLEQYKADQDACKGLSSDEAAAVVHYDCVVHCMKIANDLCKQFIDILKDYSKETEKIKKQQQLKLTKDAQEKHINKVKDILKIQSVLQQLGSEQVRRDFLAGAKGAILLYHQQLGQIHNLFRMVTPVTKDKLLDDQKQNEHLESAMSHLLALLDEQDTEVTGTTYKQLYSLIQNIYNCPYRRNGSNPIKNSKISSKIDTSRESSSPIVEEKEENLSKIKHTSSNIASSGGKNLNKNKSSEKKKLSVCSLELISKNNEASAQRLRIEGKETVKEELRIEGEQVGVNQLRQQLMDTEERLRDMERTHGTMSTKLSALTQAQVDSTEKLKQHCEDLSTQCQGCDESFKALEEKAAVEAQLQLKLTEVDAAREKAVTDLALIVKQRDSLTLTIDAQAQDIAQTQAQLQEMLTKKIVLESRLTTLEAELKSVRQELSDHTSKKESLDVFHRILVVGDERIPQLSFSKPDTLQIYSKPGLKLDNVLSFIKECNICPVTGVDTLIIVSVGINDIVEMAPVENCRTMNHDPLMVCPNYNALVASAKIITDKIYSVYTDLKDFLKCAVHFTPVLPVDLVQFQEKLLREHKDKTGHAVIVYNSLANRNLVNTKVNDIISEVNTHVQLFIGEGRHDWEIYNNTDGMQTSQFLANGFNPLDKILNIMVNKIKTIQKKHTYNEKMDSSICKLVINGIERKTSRKESLRDWGLKEENSLASSTSIRSSNYSRNKKYSKRNQSYYSRNEDEWHSPGRCVSPLDWHRPEVCRKKEFQRTQTQPQSLRDGLKFLDHSNSPNRLKELGRSPDPRSRERSRSPSKSRSRSRSRERCNQRRLKELRRSPNLRSRERSRSLSKSRSRSRSRDRGTQRRLKELGRSPDHRSRERSKSSSDSRSRSRSRDRSNQKRCSQSPDKRRKRRSRSDSSRRSNISKSSRSRSKTPEDRQEMFKSLLKTFNNIVSALDQDYKVYRASPSSHPEYNNEYAKFYESKSRTISNIGGDVSKYDFSVDWQALWPRRIKELYKESKYKLEEQFFSGLTTKDKKYFKKRIRDHNSPCSNESPKNKLSHENIPFRGEQFEKSSLKFSFKLGNEDNIQKETDDNETLTVEDMGLQEVGEEVNDIIMPLLLNQENSTQEPDKHNIDDDEPLYPMIPLQIGKFKHCNFSSDAEEGRTSEPLQVHPVLSLPTVEQLFRDLKAKPVSDQVDMFTNFSSLDDTHKEALRMLLKDIESNDIELALAIIALMD